MADPVEDKTTLEPSTSDATEDQPVEDKVVEETPVSEDPAPEEGDKQPRRERRELRYIDRLSNDIKSSPSETYDDLFKSTSYEPLKFEEGAEYEPTQLEADRKAISDNKLAEGYQLGQQRGLSAVQSLRWENQFMTGSRDVRREYPDLDAETEAEIVQDYVKYTGMTKDKRTQKLDIKNPNIDFKEFFDAEIDKREKFAKLQHEKSSENVASQAAQTGLRPNSHVKTSKGDHGFDGSSEDSALKSLAKMSPKQYHELGGKEASDAYFEEHRVGMRK